MQFKSILLIALLSAFVNAGDRTSIYYERAILQTVDSSAPANTMDANHTRMLAMNAPRKIYTQRQADALTTDAILFFKIRFGLDFAGPNAVHDVVNDRRTIPGVATLFSAFVGGCDRYHVAHDDNNPERGKSQNNQWCVINLSMIASFSGTGTLTSGTAAGQNYVPGSLISYGYTNHLKQDSDWSQRRNREVFLVKTMDLGNSFSNGEGKGHFLLRLLYTDEHGNNGRGTDAVTIWVEDGVSVNHNHHTILFDKVERPRRPQGHGPNH